MRQSGHNIRMDFQKVLATILERFEAARIAYALIGGVALNLWGVVRGTQDIDILVRREDMPQVGSVMQDLGYSVLHHTDNVTQYAHDVASFGTVDFLHAFRRPTQLMLERAEEKAFPSGLRLRVVLPEDLIGLKLQAMKNNPDRADLEMWDIKELAELHRGSLRWDDIRAYAQVFGLEEVYGKIRSHRRDA